jgi:hypothetical protein
LRPTDETPAVRAEEPAPTDLSLYAQAVVATAEAQAKAYSDLGGRDYYNLFVIGDRTLTRGVPEKSAAFTFSVPDAAALRERFNRQGPVPVLEVFPAQIKDGQLTIGVSNFWFSYHRRLLRGPAHELSLEGGATVVFRYDCDVQRFVIADVKLWGV